MFIAEAKKYQVFPLDASVAARIVAPRPNITAGRTRVRLHAADDRTAAGRLAAAAQQRPTRSPPTSRCRQGGAEGMILTSGGRFAGYGFYLLKGKPVFLWNLVDLERIKWEGPEALAARPAHGRVRLQVRRHRRRHAGVQQLQRPRPARHRHAQGGRQGGRHEDDGEDAADDPAVGRELRHRLRHADRRERRRLQAAVPAHRQAQQADDQGGPAAAVARGHQEAAGGDAGEGQARLIGRRRRSAQQLSPIPESLPHLPTRSIE